MDDKHLLILSSQNHTNSNPNRKGSDAPKFAEMYEPLFCEMGIWHYFHHGHGFHLVSTSRVRIGGEKMGVKSLFACYHLNKTVILVL